MKKHTSTITNLHKIDKTEYFLYFLKKMIEYVALPGVKNPSPQDVAFWQKILGIAGHIIKVGSFEEFASIISNSRVIHETEIMGRSFLGFYRAPESWSANLSRVDPDFLLKIHNAVHEAQEIVMEDPLFVYPAYFFETPAT